MVPPLGTAVVGVNTMTGATVVPATWDARVMDVKADIVDVMAAASLPAVKVTSVLDDILKPPVAAA